MHPNRNQRLRPASLRVPLGWDQVSPQWTRTLAGPGPAARRGVGCPPRTRETGRGRPVFGHSWAARCVWKVTGQKCFPYCIPLLVASAGKAELFLFERQQKSETVFPLRTSAYWKDKKEIILIMQPLNLPHRTGVSVGPGEPVEELLDVLFPAAPFMAVILFKVGRDLNAVVRKEFGKRLRPVGAVL